ncbi:methylated-DNA-protein-cysteine methyltransferase-like protein [Dysgonomonas sp. PH5-45]|uniref:MGMT family protein n=1 Tax=unclassified Dysgonomonas TaxID=2630389 RepID=UPI002476BE86|nr:MULTISPECIES: MGMT family protein [unclassified Dysgonomonas]MDH6353845.1 methylated-DNA-protein-cysteine methyltransferase-like protein [Dysgonomonas sp. PH5-45]MDH6386747.1 methylated-DNA-protein-cysteine methyltransferase-like protein [Dysgonomonas sp. PH5-37]
MSRMDKAEKQAFAEAVYTIARLVPCGRATSYGAIAKATGYANMPRMVGKIMSQCDSEATGVPAHRVVNSQGILSAREAFGSNGEMQQLLEAEGHTIINNKIQNWKTAFWNPLDEIQL